ncbi:MAG TPA: hypothetical protein VLB02_02870 [Candidatus Paceibacterota bacterium]|nr:hypothetical protein [Candidatus Paceibacterota bacterium]
MKIRHLPLPHGKSIALLGLCFALIGIIFYNTRDIMFGAPLTVKTITDGMTLSDTYLAIAGTAAHAQILLLNGREIYTNRKGEFSEPVLLVPGYNVIEVQMTDRFGKTNTKSYELVLTEQGDQYTLNTHPTALRQ